MGPNYSRKCKKNVCARGEISYVTLNNELWQYYKTNYMKE